MIRYREVQGLARGDRDEDLNLAAAVVHEPAVAEGQVVAYRPRYHAR